MNADEIKQAVKKPKGCMVYDWDSFVKQAKVVHGNTYKYLKKLNTNDGTHAFITCLTHGVFKQSRRSHVHKGSGCTECGYAQTAQRLTKTLAAYKKELKQLGVNAIPVEDYAGNTTKIKHSCGACTTIWLVAPAYLKAVKHKDTPCPTCIKLNKYGKGQQNKFSHEESVARIKAVHGVKLQLVGQYLGVDKRHRFRCNVCMRTWKTTFTNVVNSSKSGCPSCATQLPSRLNKSTKGYKFKTLEIQGQSFKVQGYEPQAIEWLLRNYPKIKAKDIKVDSSGEVPTIKYKIRKRNRTYFPDIFLPKLNHIIEVKSIFTLGLATGRDWKKNQQKAKAVLAAGYKFSLLVFDQQGTKQPKLPKEWYKMTRLQVSTYLAYHNPAGRRAEDTLPNKPVRTKAKIIAQTAVEAIQAMPKEERKGQKAKVIAKVTEAISKYV